jgi:hypothetical protein
MAIIWASSCSPDLSCWRAIAISASARSGKSRRAVWLNDSSVFMLRRSRLTAVRRFATPALAAAPAALAAPLSTPAPVTTSSTSIATAPTSQAVFGSSALSCPIAASNSVSRAVAWMSWWL